MITRPAAHRVASRRPGVSFPTSLDYPARPLDYRNHLLTESRGELELRIYDFLPKLCAKSGHLRSSK